MSFLVCRSDGKSGSGGRAGGGAGGSISITTEKLKGSGVIDVQGGAVVNPGSTNCPGGGGGGGRVAIYYEDNLFTGSIFSHGGRGGYECGGAGTVLHRNLVRKEGQCLFVLEMLFITIKHKYFYEVKFCNFL